MKRFSTMLRGAGGPDGEWRLLVRKYTGWRLVLHLSLAGVFFLPLVIRLLIMTGTVPGTTESELKGLQQALEHDVPVWELLVFGFLGTKSVVGWLSVGLSVALLTYNVLRIVLTARVAMLRRAGGQASAGSFHWMYRIHMPWMYVLLTLSAIYATLRIYDAVNLHALLQHL